MRSFLIVLVASFFVGVPLALADVPPGPAPPRPPPRTDTEEPASNPAPRAGCAHPQIASAAMFFVPVTFFGAGMILAARRRRSRRQEQSVGSNLEGLSR